MHKCLSHPRLPHTVFGVDDCPRIVHPGGSVPTCDQGAQVPQPSGNLCYLWHCKISGCYTHIQTYTHSLTTCFRIHYIPDHNSGVCAYKVKKLNYLQSTSSSRHPISQVLLLYGKQPSKIISNSATLPSQCACKFSAFLPLKCCFSNMPMYNHHK